MLTPYSTVSAPDTPKRKDSSAAATRSGSSYCGVKGSPLTRAVLPGPGPSGSRTL